ncbi:DUF2141 domain-containing protein [Belliella sp. DSM 111904]|uniref:DUF2141 domain-containing protein n=1 Tax=Belliella filtrata TaxID=2923435 RepID=A0ABS9V273_9BACT|nr:DUF2141 domain-containing protein [Belliella filtrata]MCH7410516.1 DUF2141 domain-containing protein [Belliella filtrata]
MNTLTISVQKIKNEQGVVRVLLFDQASGWPDDPSKAIHQATLKIEKNQAVYTFDNLPMGSYAIAVIHDSKNIGKLRTNMLGIPLDGYGFSNNAIGTFAPPSFEKAAINIQQGVNSHTIVLR